LFRLVKKSEARDKDFYDTYDQRTRIPKGVTPHIALQDARDTKKVRLRATLWGLLGPISLAWRAMTQNPMKHATERKDFLNEEHSYSNAIKHEKDIKRAQLVGRWPMAWSGPLRG
jgi:hypothetical protein